MCSYLSQFGGVVYRSKNFVSQNQLISFYNAFAKSGIGFGLLEYGNKSKNILNEIFDVSKKTK